MVIDQMQSFDVQCRQSPQIEMVADVTHNLSSDSVVGDVVMTVRASPDEERRRILCAKASVIGHMCFFGIDLLRNNKTIYKDRPERRGLGTFFFQ